MGCWARLRRSGLAVLLVLVAACATQLAVKTVPAPLPVADTRPPETQAPTPAAPPPDLPVQTDHTAVEPSASAPPPVAMAPANSVVSQALRSDDYRKEAARHIYQRLPERIYKGKLPPMLKAVVVVDMHIEPSGQVGAIHWVRVPQHALEVKQDIEQAIRQSAPFPAPQYLHRVSFTETWLWHRTGRFQLDALTEGQH